MYEDRYCEMRLRGMKIKEELERGLWGDKGECVGETRTHTSFGGNERLVYIRIKGQK
jgi:hypothetical protein